VRPHTPLFLEGFPQVGLTVGLILLDTLLQGNHSEATHSVALEDRSTPFIR